MIRVNDARIRYGLQYVLGYRRTVRNCCSVRLTLIFLSSGTIFFDNLDSESWLGVVRESLSSLSTTELRHGNVLSFEAALPGAEFCSVKEFASGTETSPDNFENIV